ncbi:MAG: type IV toxin-antitoxin system AbiEi family antitoxin domain-containing protein [Pirellulales bacterium]
MALALGNLEAEFFAYIQMRSMEKVRNGDLLQPLGINIEQERKLLSRLARRGLIVRVRRGLYLVPRRLPPGGRWSPGEFVALASLMADCGGTYQLCGPIAFHRYGWDDQVPNRLCAYNNRISGERRVGTASITLIRVTDDRLGETDAFRTPDDVQVVYSSRTRTLIDAVYDWSRFGSLPRAYGWIRAEITEGRVSPADLIRVARRYGNIGTCRRLGRLLEAEGVTAPLLRRLEREIPPSTALIPWIPTLPKKGSVDRRWGVLVNEPV